MKTICSRVFISFAAAGGLAFVSGCVIEPNGAVAFQPLVVAPAPVVEVDAAPVEAVVVPDTYVWDGVEFVGFVGGGYVYLGPNHVWLVADRMRLDRFHGWERYHPDWRQHAIVNRDYRRDAHGHEQPMHDERLNHGEPGQHGDNFHPGEPGSEDHGVRPEDSHGGQPHVQGQLQPKKAPQKEEKKEEKKKDQ